MAKRLVICCDGTWNSLGQPAPTNVVRVRNAVAGTDPAGVRQLVHYRAGVGAGKKLLEHLAGGLFGVGLSAAVRDAYRFVVENYEPGDELFFFGFSRGAYTARSTVGLIRNCGVLRPGEAHRIDEAYRLYRDRDPATGPASPAARRFRRDHAHEDETPVRFVGVWDTVGALGIPMSGGRLVNLLNRRWRFHDTQLARTVQSAFQALAVDEHRKSFAPAIWAPCPDDDGTQQREQVWFAGAHSDVGGGYPEPELANLALGWMAGRAEKCGLVFRPDAFAGPPPRNELAVLHRSLNAFFRCFGSVDREVGRTDPASEAVASCVQLRHRRMRPPYEPATLTAYFADPDHRITPV
jgi:uncharacterized protein (DUF2235 family)